MTRVVCILPGLGEAGAATRTHPQPDSAPDCYLRIVHQNPCFPCG